MDRHCHIEGCGREVPKALARETLCLDHFADMVIAQTDAVRAKCLGAEPIDEAMLEWLLSDAPHKVQALAGGESGSEARNNERILELLLCLSNLHNYIRHHSLEVKRST
ncbi:MAG TPA: hypothetical protein VGR81_02225 [Candidatus Acidoferrales bacterium]|nr:hypothetical protein [Candidatus Acidoferrales bacterium]